MMKKYISIDIFGDLGTFKKSDGNAIMFTSYNMIPYTVVLGILGAILGLEGYKKKEDFPEFYNILKGLNIGIKPLSKNGNGIFQKGRVEYTNTSGFANTKGDGEKKYGTVLIIKEQFLIHPSYRIYIELDKMNTNHKRLYNLLKNGESTFNIYLGKNEFFATYDNFREYKVNAIEDKSNIRISSIFSADRLKPNFKKEYGFSLSSSEETNYILFERIPVGFDENTGNYILEKFCYTNMKLSLKRSEGLFLFESSNIKEVVFLF